jgi:hypothetical protein
MKDFLKTENELREARYAKNLADEGFLLKLNESLKDLEQTISDYAENGIPNIYIFGLPRSGTTLVYQLLASCLDVTWPTNLMARFWETPVIGMRLSKILGLFEQQSDFSSEFGVTKGAHGPHEFGYFWMNWLNYWDNVMKSKAHEETIDWDNLRKKLNSVSTEAGKPVVYKNMLYAFHLERFAQIQPDSIFIYCKRDLADVATSILRTRENRYGDKNIWWSFKPPDYRRVLAESCYEQIIYQVKYGHEYFEKIIANLKSNHVVLSIDYNKINSELDKLIKTIMDKVKISKKIDSLPYINISSYTGSDDYLCFKEALLKI